MSKVIVVYDPHARGAWRRRQRRDAIRRIATFAWDAFWLLAVSVSAVILLR